jgi:hypothetical protein
MLDGLHADRRDAMRFACAGPTDQDNVVGFIEEVAAMKLTHERFVDLAACEVECRSMITIAPLAGL